MHRYKTDKDCFRGRISVGNMISLDCEMFRYSTTSLLMNAGVPMESIDYVVVTWKASEEVLWYLDFLKRFCYVHHLVYTEDESIGYVPNLRAMFNTAFSKCFELNEYACLVNSDIYFGKDWLVNLVKYANENDIVNSLHISPARGRNIVTADLGSVREGEFAKEQFELLYKKLYTDRIQTEKERGGWRSTNTLPYVFHRKWWELCGPWELEIGKDKSKTPDVRFFQRCHDAGARFVMSLSSIVYHQEAGERKFFKQTKEFGHMEQETGI